MTRRLVDTETLSPSTLKGNQGEKEDICALKQSYILQDDKEDEHYNAKEMICLIAFLNLKMELQKERQTLFKTITAITTFDMSHGGFFFL